MNWVVVPAGGIGSRMQADVPKQYLGVLGASVLEHTLRRLLTHPRIDGVVVAVAADDFLWRDLAVTVESKPVLYCIGGADRAASVEAGLVALPDDVETMDWVLVHDAARPCVRHQDLDRLFDALDTPGIAGALLAAPVRDTLKQSCGPQGTIAQSTVDRGLYWRAFTPQAFRRGELLSCLRAARVAGRQITDEASAMEGHSLPIRLIESGEDNIKLTTPSDLAMIEFILQKQAANSD